MIVKLLVIGRPHARRKKDMPEGMFNRGSLM